MNQTPMITVRGLKTAIHVRTSFNGEDTLKDGEMVAQCVCGCTFIAHPETQTCVKCSSTALTCLIHHVRRT